MSRTTNFLRFMLFAFLVMFITVGTMITFDKVSLSCVQCGKKNAFSFSGVYSIAGLETTDSDERQTLPVTIDAEGVVQNGPFRTCECSGNVFFGEDRVECLQERPHRAGDVVVFCIWNEMLRIRAIDHVFVMMNQNRTYPLIHNNIPDIHTQSFLQTRAAAVTTVLDPVWFLETSNILGLQVELQGEAVFQTTEEYGSSHLVDVKQNPYKHLRHLAQTETARPGKKGSRSAMITVVVTVLLIMATFIFVMGCFVSSMVLKKEEKCRSEHWERVRQNQQDEFQKHLSDHSQTVTVDGYMEQFSDDDTADHTSTTAQVSGEEGSMRP